MQLRARKRSSRSGMAVSEFVAKISGLSDSPRLVVFSGAGISFSAGSSSLYGRPLCQTHTGTGMSLFSTPGGLYDRARKKHGLADGTKLFSDAFFRENPAALGSFLAAVHEEALAAAPTPSHLALTSMCYHGSLVRHYSMNIDGLSKEAGMQTWDATGNPTAPCVELHGSLRHVVCGACLHSEPATADVAGMRALHITRILPITPSCPAALLKRGRRLPCPRCGPEVFLRYKVMLYGDTEGHCIHHDVEQLFATMARDVAACDAVVWAGISFVQVTTGARPCPTSRSRPDPPLCAPMPRPGQSASVEYFRRVRAMTRPVPRRTAEGVEGAAGEAMGPRHFLVNPDEDALFSLVSACSNADELRVQLVCANADEVLTALASRLLPPSSAPEGAGPAKKQKREVPG
jgi:NAD-dependent SIR2 family protein deacetylase